MFAGGRAASLFNILWMKLIRVLGVTNFADSWVEYNDHLHARRDCVESAGLHSTKNVSLVLLLDKGYLSFPLFVGSSPTNKRT